MKKTIKRTGFLLTVVMIAAMFCAFGLTVSAADAECSHTFTDGACTVCGITGGYCGKTDVNEGKDVQWTLTGNQADGYTLTISGTGAMQDWSAGSAPWYGFNDFINTVVIENGVTSIGTLAFGYCVGLESVNIPASVTRIGDEAFENCIALASVTIPDSVTSIGTWAFYGCSSLESVDIPDSVKSIGNIAFGDCTGLTSVTIGNSVESIGDDVFNGCSNLTSVTIGNSVTSIGEYAFSNCSSLTSVTIPDSVKSIHDFAFQDCVGLKSVTIPNSVTSIGIFAFFNCSSLTNVTIGNSVESIGNSAFAYCTDLTGVTIGNSVTNIGTLAFDGCTALTTVNVPCGWNGSLYTFADTVTVNNRPHNFATENGNSACTVCGITGGYCGATGNEQSVIWTLSGGTLTISGTGAMQDWTVGKAPWYGFNDSINTVVMEDGVASIGKYAFYGCSNLTNVNIPASVMSIGNSAFADCTNLTSMNIPASVTSIGNSAFADCTNLTSMNIPASVTRIGMNAFYNCTNLTSVNIPASVTRISDSAFFRCTGLTSVTIPASVTHIGSNAFNSCTSLTSVNIPASVTSIYSGAFYRCTGLTSVNIPASVTNIDYDAFDGCTNLKTVNVSCNWNNLYTFGEGVTLNKIIHTPAENATCTINPDGTHSYTCSLCSETATEAHTFANGTCNVCGVTGGYCGDTTVNGGKDVQWVLTGNREDGYTLTISGTGAIPNWTRPSNKPWYRFNAFINTVVIEKGVTSIGMDTFHDCMNLTSVTIPDSVTSIGMYAFQDCNSLTSVTIPDSVTSINAYAFRNCSNLTSVTIPASVTTIHSTAFNGCTALTTVNVPCTWNDSFYTFADTVTVNNRPHNFATENGNSACTVCGITGGYCGATGNEQSVIWTLSGGKLTISGTGAMQDWTVGKAPWYGFNDSINTVVMEDGVTSIGGSAFFQCYKLTSVTIPDSVTSIGNSAFQACGFLSEVTIPASVKIIGNDAFTLCEALTEVTIPDSVKTIGNFAFSECFRLQKVTIGDSVETIGKYAFFYCDSLTSVTIGNSVTSIGSNAFSDCTNLTTVNAPCSWNNTPLYSFAEGVTVKLADHTLVYSSDGNTVTESCSKDCGYTATAVISAENAIYDGNAKETANVTYSNNWLGGTLTVSYVNNVNAGTATASITKDSATASVIFTVEKATIARITVDVTAPEAGAVPQTTVEAGTGYSAEIKWNETAEKFDFNTAYTATVTLTADGNHKFASELIVDGWTVSHTESVLRLTKIFEATRKEKLTALTHAPADQTLIGYHTAVSGAISELPTTVTYTTESGEVTVEIEWTCDNYDPTVKATNTFTWSVKSGMPDNYDVNGAIIDSTVTVTNVALIPVTNSGSNTEITYEGTFYDVSAMFAKDANAGEASYAITGGDGDGTLDGSKLTITKAGTIEITMTTALNEPYAAGSAVATLTVKKAAGAGSVTIEGWTYGETAKAPSAIGTGEITYQYNTADGNVPADAGTYTVTATFAENDLYMETSAVATFTIAPKELTAIVSGSATKAYDGTNNLPEEHDLSIDLDGIVGNDRVSVTGTGIYGDVNAGTTRILVSDIILIGGDASNYKLTNTTASADVGMITKAVAPEILWPTDAYMDYGQKLSESQMSSNDINGTFAWQDGNIAPDVRNDGYVLVYTPKDTDNYDYDGVELTKVIHPQVYPASVFIVLDDKTICVGGTVELTYTISGLLGDDKMITLPTLSLEEADLDTVGVYEIITEGADAGDNYIIATARGTVTVIAHADGNADHLCDNGCGTSIGTHADANRDHNCDYGCSVKIGAHEDADMDHSCDYGCSVKIGACADADRDHNCDYGCSVKFGTHEDADRDHNCDYGCSVEIGTCADGDQDHNCDYGCNESYGAHRAADGEHFCVYCGGTVSDCRDYDADHVCDVCEEELAHSHSSAWFSDGINHWHECSCGDKIDMTAHIPGAEATATTAQTCTVCGYVLKDKTGEVTTTVPEVTTTAPEVTTTAPEVTTTEPAVTTAVPAVTTTEPAVTTAVPAVTTTEPAVTTTEPVETTTESVTTTGPVATVTEPGESEPQTPDEPQSPDEDKGLPTGAIIAILVVIVGVGAFVIVWFVIKKKFPM